MGRGLLLGTLSGLVVALLGLGGLSVMAPAPPGTEPPATPQIAAPETPAPAPETEPETEPGDSPDPAPEPATTARAVPEPAQPADGDLPANEEDSAPAQPVTDLVPDAPLALPPGPSVVAAAPTVPTPETPAAPDRPSAESASAPTLAAAPERPSADVVVEAPADPDPVPEVPAASDAPLPGDGMAPEATPEAPSAPDPVPAIATPAAPADPAPESPAPDAEEPPAVIVNRPADPEPEPEPAPDVEEVVVVEEAVLEGPALDLFAGEWSNPDDLPLLSIVLIDDVSIGNAVQAIEAIPFTVTILLDPARPGAAERMAEYRSRGIEVMALIDLPSGSSADIEAALAAGFDTIPESVAMATLGAGPQSGDPALEQTLAYLADAGRGLVLEARGLNTVVRAAERLGVPAATIFRDLDGEGQDDRVIRRFLDQAAFRARQESGVILVARIRAETITALNLWGFADRAGQVAIVPVSAILKSR